MLLHGGDVVEVADVLAGVLGGRLAVYDDERRLLAGTDAPVTDDVVRQARASGRCVQTDDGAWVAVAAAGEDHLGTLVLRTDGPMELPERRTLERGALVAALVLLFGRTEAEAESRVRGELLVDLLAGRDPDRALERARLRGAAARRRPERRRRRGCPTPTGTAPAGWSRRWPPSSRGSAA